MRKIVILVLVATMFMLNACSGKGTDTSSLSENLKTEEQTTYSTVHENLLMQAKVKKAKIKNGLGTGQVGERAYIEINKEDLRNVTQEDFKEFASSVVKDSGYNWVSIICNDGTGICFIGSMEYLAQYGKIDNEGAIEEVIGDITIGDSGTYIYEER